MSRSLAHRARIRAARAWDDGRPHEALLILRDAGLKQEWADFVRVAHRRARARFRARMPAGTLR